MDTAEWLSMAQQDCKKTYILIIKLKWTKSSNQNLHSGWIDTKLRTVYIPPTGDSLQV